jgi:DNA-binding response OmpR family regulator
LRSNPIQNPRSGRPNVLVVDDDSYMREVLQEQLAKAGYGVAVAEDATAAHGLLPGFAPDLILIDVQLPYRNGLDFVCAFLADSAVPCAAVVFISSYGQFASTARALGAGFLLKPFLKRELLEAVSTSLARAGAGEVARAS